MDKIIMGDNQFFGVSHMSEQKGMDRAIKFQDTSAIINVLEMAYDCGIHAFSFTTHDRMQQICEHFRANPKKFSDLRLYPSLPYAHKYAHLVNEKGIIGAIKDTLVSDSSAGQIVDMIARGGALVLTQDSIKTMKLLIDVEMRMFRDLNIKAIFLQNIVTDLLLGIGIKEVFLAFVEYIEKKYAVQAGFMTLNMPMLVDFLLDAGIKNPVVCSAINKIGFQMNPDIASYEQTLRSKSFVPLAMSVMAAGAVPPQEAFEYVASQNVKSILFGASTRAHIEQAKELFEKYS